MKLGTVTAAVSEQKCCQGEEFNEPPISRGRRWGAYHTALIGTVPSASYQYTNARVKLTGGTVIKILIVATIIQTIPLTQVLLPVCRRPLLQIERRV